MRAMSASGTKRTFLIHRRMSVIGVMLVLASLMPGAMPNSAATRYDSSPTSNNWLILFGAGGGI